ncbi:class F sortase [Blastococcus sp. TML/M2B]|uniref:class F sortase n=1 Tax=unclassified Blastococcus TaxID=2619396 RepID=UPI00190BC911|nr:MULTISPECIES: class F sortase [unclassified Blastococcus]MBN1091378.1 class F sortase [Blastococcus sp. TML/M2B]MBN1095066.1 class F sortase [Blastococcus sp. TML/C7B]
MRFARAADLRAAGAFLVVLAAGLGMLLLVAGRPGADDAPQPAPAAAAPGEVLATGPIQPAALSIPAIGVDSPVESRGTVRYENPFTGQPVDGYGVPESMRTTSWWSDGPLPGSGQMAVILGHQQAGGGAVFDRLHTLAPGDEVTLRDGAGAVLRLQVLGEPVTGLDKATSALSDTLNAHPAGADVALVTCGGEFVEDAGASTDNTVVFATVVR